MPRFDLCDLLRPQLPMELEAQDGLISQWTFPGECIQGDGAGDAAQQLKGYMELLQNKVVASAQETRVRRESIFQKQPLYHRPIFIPAVDTEGIDIHPQRFLGCDCFHMLKGGGSVNAGGVFSLSCFTLKRANNSRKGLDPWPQRSGTTTVPLYCNSVRPHHTLYSQLVPLAA